MVEVEARDRYGNAAAWEGVDPGVVRGTLASERDPTEPVAMRLQVLAEEGKVVLTCSLSVPGVYVASMEIAGHMIASWPRILQVRIHSQFTEHWG